MTDILKKFVLPFFAGALLTLTIVIYSTLTNNLNAKLLIILGVGIFTIALLLINEYSRWILFCLAILSIAFGYRSIHLGYWTFLVPFQIIFGGLWVVLLLISLGKCRHISIPGTLFFVAVWSILHGLVSWLTGTDWDEILSWMLPLIIGIPTFWVVSRMVKDLRRVETVMRLFLAVAAFMSICEILEYFFPATAAAFPWFFHPQPIYTQDGFIRGTFSFWGYPAGASVVVFGMLIAYDNILRSKNLGLRLISIPIFAMGAVAVYVSGQRSSWLGLGLALILLSLTNKMKGIIPLGLFIAATVILPPVFFARADTLVTALNGNVTDGSLLSRIARWNWAIDAIQNSPVVGVGYGHWLAHNIFLEIGSTIGIVAAIAFLVFVIHLIVRIAKVALAGSTPEARQCGWLFLAIAVTWIVQFNVETIFQTPPLAVAFWPTMALAWYLPDLFRKLPDKDAHRSPARIVP